MKLLLYITILSFFSLLLKSQSPSDALQIGDKLPSIVVTTSENSIQSFNFPYGNKIMLVHFWTSSAPKSLKDFYKFALIHKKYANESYKTCDGFDMLTIALQSDKKEWQRDISKYKLESLNNGICLKGFNDFNIRNFKLSQVPTTYLVNEFGKIIAIDPDVNTIINYLDERRDYIKDLKEITKITGKILVGNQTILPLINEKIYLLNDHKDTVQVTTTNENGKFTISNPNVSGITLNIHKNEKIKEDDNVLLANEKGVVVSEFIKGETSFEYRLLDIEMSFLKPLNEPLEEIKLKTFIKELYFSENLYENGGFALSAKSKVKLDALLVKLKDYPKANVEIISHSDSRGSSENNKALSLKRSISIANYFESKGLAKNRMKVVGKGESDPLNRCIDGVECSEEELNVNRRTEFIFYQNE